MTFVVEWKAEEPASHNVIWLKTITANAAEPMGSSFTLGKHQRVLTQKLFDDLSNTNSWVTLTRMTLQQPLQLWVDTNADASLPAHSHRFYQVLPGP